MSSRPLISCLLPLAALAAGACDRRSADTSQANAAAPAAASPDEVVAPPAAPPAVPIAAGAVDRTHKGEAAPDVAFEAPDGTPARLGDFRGHPVLVNLWATWCAPCIKEMPTLDAAAAALAGRVGVLAVSQDLDAAKVAPFFAAHGYRALKPYRDPKLALSLAYQANLPTTILLDRNGKELWRVTGGLDWSGATAKALLAEAR